MSWSVTNYAKKVLRSSAVMTRRVRTNSRRLNIESLEDRVTLDATLLHSLFPDATVPKPDANFGQSVAVSSNTVVIGDWNDTGATVGGSAYVYDAITGALVATLNDPTPVQSDNFGYSVSVSESTVVVAEPSTSSAYVYDANTGVLVTTLNDPTPAVSDAFGASVSVSGNTVVVGESNAGSAYVFDATTGALVATLYDPTPEQESSFGVSVAISGNTMVVGDLGSDSAYVFDALSGVLTATLNAPIPDSSFGYSVAVSGNTVIVGAIAVASGAGSAYLFDATTGGLLTTLNNPTPSHKDFFGWSVSVSGSTAVVGARFGNTETEGAGSAYVFDSTTGLLVATIINPTPVFADEFGRSVAVSGNTVLVGAPFANTGVTHPGAAYVYALNTRTVELQEDPCEAGKTMLVAWGTSGNDKIVFKRAQVDGEVLAIVNGTTYGPFAPTGRLVAYGLGGDDEIRINNLDISAWLHGGDGNDMLYGGSGADILLGEAGNDLLFGRGGRDILIGGDGEDDVNGGGGDDIMIGGKTAFDANDLALCLIRREWTSYRSFARRMDNLRGISNRTFDQRANANYFFTIGSGGTVRDDDAHDHLTGNDGNCWYFGNVEGNGIRDDILDFGGKDVLNDV